MTIINTEHSELITPAKNIVILKKHTLKTKSGLISGDPDSKEYPELGTIVAVGEGEQPLPLAEGTVVAYKRWTEFKIVIGSDEFIFVEFKDILGVINEHTQSNEV